MPGTEIVVAVVDVAVRASVVVEVVTVPSRLLVVVVGPAVDVVVAAGLVAATSLSR